MNKRISLNTLTLLLAALVGAGIWVLARRAATPDAYPAVAAALRRASPADVESITVYPLLPDQRGAARPFQLRTAAAIAPLLRGLRQLQPLAVDERTFQPLLDATVTVRLTTALAEAQHLHSRDVIFRLATSPQGQVALRADSRAVYQSTLLGQQVQQARDSLAAAR